MELSLHSARSGRGRSAATPGTHGERRRCSARRARRAALALATWAALAAAFATPALAGGWQAPTVLTSVGHEGRSPAVAVGSHGDAVAVWLNRYGFNWDIDASVRAGGGAWQEPVEVSTPGDIGFNPEVAIDSHGDAVAVWRDGNAEEIEAAVRRAGGEWEAPVAISASGGNEKPEVAVDSSGEAVVVWEHDQSGDSNGAVQAAVGSLESDVWQEPVELSTSGQSNSNPRVAVNGEGEADVVWESYNEGVYSIQTVAGSIGHDTWGEPVALSLPGQVTANPEVADDAEGEAVAVWEQGGDELTPYTVQGAVRPAGGQWGAPVDLSAAGSAADFPNVGVDAQGDAVAVWEIRESNAGYSQSAVWTAATGVWQAPVDLSTPGGNAGSPQVAVDPRGDAVTIVSGGGSIQGAVRPAEGEWGALVEVGPGSFTPALAGDEEGNAVAVWEGTLDGEGVIQSASYLTESEQPGGGEEPPTGEEPKQPGGEEKQRGGEESKQPGGGGSEPPTGEGSNSPAAKKVGGGEESTPFATEHRPAPARGRCAAAASKRTAGKAHVARHHGHRGAARGCAARVRTADHARGGH